MLTRAHMRMHALTLTHLHLYIHTEKSLVSGLLIYDIHPYTEGGKGITSFVCLPLIWENQHMLNSVIQKNQYSHVGIIILFICKSNFRGNHIGIKFSSTFNNRHK